MIGPRTIKLFSVPAARTQRDNKVATPVCRVVDIRNPQTVSSIGHSRAVDVSLSRKENNEIFIDHSRAAAESGLGGARPDVVTSNIESL